VRCVHRIITDLGVFDTGADGLKLVELAAGVELNEVQAKTGVPIRA
jgi:3-oxoacid CoA-transferase subunit B